MATNYSALPAPSPEQGMSRYLTEIRKFPMLEPDEEFMLAKAWVDNGDRESAHKLVTSHLRLAAKIAMGYRGYVLPSAASGLRPTPCGGSAPRSRNTSCARGRW